MRNYLYILIAVLLFSSCQNKENVFPDYTNTAVYFPIQYPLRTLILGDSRSDNSLDKQLKFSIGASVGGMYENKNTWNVDFVVDNSLITDAVFNPSGEPVLALPTAYYTITPSSAFTINPSSFNGTVQVQLTDAFLDDPLAISQNYVIPLRITSTNADSILTGIPVVPNPNRLRSTDYNPKYQAKDFVLFGVKFINPYHGNYFRRGKDVSSAGTVTYREQFVERDPIVKLLTTGRNSLNVNSVAKFIANDGTYRMKMDVASNGDVTISPSPGSTLSATGTGKYVKDGELWGGTKHHAFYLNYNYTQAGINHVVNDTLVFRDNAVIYEEMVVSVP